MAIFSSSKNWNSFVLWLNFTSIFVISLKGGNMAQFRGKSKALGEMGALFESMKQHENTLEGSAASPEVFITKNLC